MYHIGNLLWLDRYICDYELNFGTIWEDAGSKHGSGSNPIDLNLYSHPFILSNSDQVGTGFFYKNLYWGPLGSRFGYSIF